MVTINENGRDEPPVLTSEEEEDHDGWGPIRPRRSSLPPDHDDDATRETIPLICAPHPDGQPDKT